MFLLTYVSGSLKRVLPLVILLLLAACNTLAIAQVYKTSNVWCFGNNLGLDFNHNPPSLSYSSLTSATGITRSTIAEGCATVSDSAGRLLFYTSGERIWNRNHQLMPNAGYIGGNFSSTQSSLILRHPRQRHLYYVFTTKGTEIINWREDFPPTVHDKGSYTVIDMRREGGLGDVHRENDKFLRDVPFMPEASSEKLTAIRIPGCSPAYWLITHGAFTNRFYTYRFDAEGLHADSVVSATGSVYGFANQEAGYFQEYGQFKASLDGKSLVAASSPQRLIELYDFDVASGRVSVREKLSLKDSTLTIRPYGVSFSPNDSLIYVSVVRQVKLPQYATPATGSEIWQFERYAPNVFSTKKVVKRMYADEKHYFPVAGALQLAPDGTIYLNYQRPGRFLFESDNRFIARINKPDLRGEACSVDDKAFVLSANGQRSSLSLPNFVDSEILADQVQFKAVATASCVGQPVAFKDSSRYRPRSWYWEFGDGTTSTAKDPVHIYTTPGKYTVRLTVGFDYCRTLTLVKDNYLLVGHCVQASFATPDTLCARYEASFSSTSVHATAYQWSFGDGTTSTEQNPVHLYEQEGQYIVTLKVSNAVSKAVISDTITVRPCEALFVPNVFTPNQDGFNDAWHVKGEQFPSFRVEVYNRWGQKVYESKRFDFAWNGEGQSSGVYYYYIRAVGYNKKLLEVKGHVSLLR